MDVNSAVRRSNVRTSMFVLATMAASSTAGPVRIRNMSPAGAMFEGEYLPSVGELVSLRRGTLSASGTVIWRLEGKAGVRFDRPIDVTGWLPAGSIGQQAIDRTFQELKAVAAAPSYPTQVPQIQPSPVDTAELLRTAAALDDLADALAEDPAVVAIHGSKLQTFDIAAQLLRRYAASLP